MWDKSKTTWAIGIAQLTHHLVRGGGRKFLDFVSRDFCTHRETRGKLIVQYRSTMSFIYINTWFCWCSAAIEIKDVTQSSICHDGEKIIFATSITVKCAAVTIGINKLSCSFIQFLQRPCIM